MDLRLQWARPSPPSKGLAISVDEASARSSVERITETVLPTRHGVFRIVGYRGCDGTELVSLSIGIDDERPHSDAPLVRLHSECLTGDTLGSRRCDCGEQLDAALALIAAEGEGVLVYVRGHEGRGIGLLEKLRAYRLQDQGFDTVDANLRLGHPADARDYGHAADILRDLGVHRLRLVSSNPAKQQALARLGLTVTERVGAGVPARPENARYLLTKQRRMQHDDRRGRHASATVARPLQTDAAPGWTERYGRLADGAEWTIAQSAQSLDGYLATSTGDGAELSGLDDRRHLHHLRALADAVVVGAQTVINDDPLLTVRLVPGTSPTRVVLDPHGRIPADSRLLTQPNAPTVWVTGPDAPSAHAPHVQQLRLGQGPWHPGEVLDQLRARGLRRVLVEGGGRTVSRFLDAEALDLLFVTTVPILLGEGVPGVRPAPAARIADAPRWPARRFMLGEDVCTEFTLR